MLQISGNNLNGQPLLQKKNWKLPSSSQKYWQRHPVYETLFG